MLKVIQSSREAQTFSLFLNFEIAAEQQSFLIKDNY